MEGLRKTVKATVRITGSKAKNLTQDLTNMEQEC
jgi:hypothetical protein